MTKTLRFSFPFGWKVPSKFLNELDCEEVSIRVREPHKNYVPEETDVVSAESFEGRDEALAVDYTTQAYGKCFDNDDVRVTWLGEWNEYKRHVQKLLGLGLVSSRGDSQHILPKTVSITGAMQILKERTYLVGVRTEVGFKYKVMTADEFKRHYGYHGVAIATDPTKKNH